MIQSPQPPPSDDEEGINSSDEALYEMLGIRLVDAAGLQNNSHDEEEGPKHSHNNCSFMTAVLEDDAFLQQVCTEHGLKGQYASQSCCVFPSCLSIPENYLQRLTDELVWSGETIRADKSYEHIQVCKNGEVFERRVLTRLENFVSYHDEWKMLCCDYIPRCLAFALGESMILFKEKLNLKPPGGSGFAPHLDTPSLRVALGENGPQNFVTVMIAIDNMSSENGCLRIAKGKWTEDNCCQVVQPNTDESPDAGGRAGAIPAEVSDQLEYNDICCKAGEIVAFNGWTPHRSSANASPFPRRAVFLTYNPASEGDHHEAYYKRMEELRNGWREKVGLVNNGGGIRQLSHDEQEEMAALATIPRI